MRFAASLFVAAALCAAAPLHVQQSAFRAGADGVPAGWKTWAARPEIMPRTFLDAVHYRNQPASLAISGNSNPAAYGGWEYSSAGVEAGKWYRLEAYYRAESVPFEALQVVARLDWTTAEGERTGQPDYAYLVTPAGDWKRLHLEAPAPKNAQGVKIQLYLANAPQGTVWWDEISLDQIRDPGPRPVSVAAVNLKPSNTGSAAESVRRFLKTIDEAVLAKTDIILLPEGITVVGTGKKYADVAESIPGPTTASLAEVAKRRRCYMVAGVYEREGAAIYNTAVLIDRFGKIAGKYRKVYLPREEIEAGITPGQDYPVFRTDFGTVGMMICWDLEYADPARVLAKRGAELILMPIWGGNEALGKARAIENHVFLAASGYDYPTYILDPTGEMLSMAPERGKVAMATIDLNRRYVDPWLGEMKGRMAKELRLDIDYIDSVR